MEFILMRLFPSLSATVRIIRRESYLQISQLCKLFPTTIQLTCIRFRLGVRKHVRPHIAFLGKTLAAYFAFERSLARMSSFVGL